jgi:hypothetical protein
MPLARIDPIKGEFTDYRRTISDVVYRLAAWPGWLRKANSSVHRSGS